MANVLLKRLLNRNLIKFRECTDLRSYCLCTNVLFIETPRFIGFQTSFNHGNHLNNRIYSNWNLLENYRFLHNTNVNLNDRKDDQQSEPQQKLSIFKKFKEMYKRYWYVVLPVHFVTSAFWFGGFYYLAKSGVDVPSLLESLHVSETIINTMKKSHMGHLAVAFALYKIATPARYAVTLGGTTVAINYLRKWGYIKPIPSRERLKEIYQEKKDSLMQGIKTKSDNEKKS